MVAPMQPPNPYAAPIAQDAPSPAGANAELEAIRRAHLSAETNIKSIGSLAILGAVLQVLAAIEAMAHAPAEGIGRLVAVAAIGASGFMLRDLKPVGRIIYTVMLGIGLVSTVVTVLLGPAQAAVPVAIVTLVVGGLFLWVLWNGKAKVVFSEHYRQVVIPQTPYVKYKTSKVAIAVLIVLLLVFFAAVVAALVG